MSSDMVRAVTEEPSRYSREDKLPPGFIAWDMVAVFSSSASWQDNLPVPTHYGGPVVNAIAETRQAIGDELSAAASKRQ